jgi:CHAD domain-containing protein
MEEHVERELKLVPPPDFRLPELGGVPLPDREFVSTYYDTRDLRLGRHGVTLRHRSEGGTRVWQLKIPRGAARIELEEPGPPARPPATLLRLLAAHLRDATLIPVARLRTRRKTVRADGAEIVDDSVAILDGQRVTGRFRELEVELLEGDERALQRLEHALREAGAEPGKLEPKLFRVLDLAYPVGRVEISAKASPTEALGAALHAQYEQLLAHDPGTRLGSNPEDLHQMRVATRRARAFLRTARPLVDTDWADGLRDELGWLGSALGPARDADVLSEHLRQEIAALGEGGEPARGLLDLLAKDQSDARATAVATLSDQRYFALLDRLERAREPARSREDGPTLADLWWDEFRKVRRRFSDLGPDSSDTELHAARIRVKRARYAAELASHELGDAGAKFVSAAKKVQDVLGEHQDAYVAEARITAWREEGGDARIAENLAAREQARREKARSDWPAAWKKLKRRAKQARP